MAADYGAGYSTTSYGAQGGAGGGGFMGSSQGGSQSGGGKSQYSKDTLRPVSIMQVQNASQPHPDADFSVDDVEITQITFVGQIRNISTQPTNVTYKLDDGTGTVEVKQWVDTDTSTSIEEGVNTKPKLAENDWARVWGRVRAFGGRRHVGAHVIRPIPDKMEIIYHLLEATYVHLYFTRGPPAPPAEQERTSKQVSVVAGGYGDSASTLSRSGGGGEGGGAGGAGQMMPNLSENAKRVFQSLKSTPQNNEGLHVQNIAASVGMSLNEVLKAGDELLSHSLIYPTVDDLTWALLDF